MRAQRLSGTRSGGRPPTAKASVSKSLRDSGTMGETIENGLLTSSLQPSSAHFWSPALYKRAAVPLLSPCLLFTYSTVQYMNKLNAESSLDTRRGGGRGAENIGAKLFFQGSRQQSKLLGHISLKVLLKKQVM